MGIFTGVGSPGAMAAASGGKVTGFVIPATTAALAIAGNPQRQSITFHNPGTVNVYVAPTITATGATLSPTLSALAGTFIIFPGGLLVITGECQTPWQAFAASATNNPLTIMESNV